MTMTGEALIVDDMPENLPVLSAILSGPGLTVRLAPCGAFALRSVQARIPHLIVLDLHMPAMAGFETDVHPTHQRFAAARRVVGDKD